MHKKQFNRRRFLQSATAAGAGAAAAALIHPSVADASTPLILENINVRLEVDAGSGAVRRIYNKTANLELIDPSYPQPATPVPWKIETTPGSDESSWLTPSSSGSVFSSTSSTGQLNLNWACSNGLTVQSVIKLGATDTDLTFAASIQNTGTQSISVLEYPVIRGINRLAGAAVGDYLLHPYATGFLFRNPADLFPVGGGIPESPYPEGFNGASSQVMSYYGQGVGGFYLAVHDPTGWVKWLDFFKNGTDSYLEARFLHSAAGIAAGNSLNLPYAVHVGTLTEGNWYEAADRYRSWATTQVFCQRGPLRTRSDRSSWLLENVGFAVFGVNTQYDRTPWLQFFHQIANKPVFHITGPNWQHGRWDYLGNQSGGPESVFPAAIVPSYTSTLSAQGDYFAPFSFSTIFFDSTSSDSAEANASMLVLPGRDTAGNTNTLSRDSYAFDFTCPVPELQTRESIYRDSNAISTLGANAIYYDIGPNNVMHRCLSTTHGHAPGGGSEISGAYRSVLARVRAACAVTGNGYIPLGCEMVNELFIPEMDFYQARAEASPASSFEAYSFHAWIKAGSVEKVPLFAYLYHEYGPIRLDGWGRLAAEQGDLFYFLASRVFAWGGLYELDYEFTSLDVVGTNRDDMTQSYTSFEIDRDYNVNTSMKNFLAEIANARTGFANPYVAYGHMLRPLTFSAEPPPTTLPWFHYNASPDALEYQDGGSLTVSSVVHAAWRYAATKCGFIFINLLTSSQTVTVTIDPTTYGLSSGSGLHVYQVTNAGATDLGSISGAASYSMTLASRIVTMLELRVP